MSKLKLEFNLPEEKEDADVATHAVDLYFSLYDIDNFLRECIKYNKVGFDVETADKIRDKLYEILEEHSVSLDLMS